MASYIVSTDDITKVVAAMSQLARQCGGAIKYKEQALQALSSGTYRRIKWFYYCDDFDGITIRLYDREFASDLSYLFQEPKYRVIVRGTELGKEQESTKQAMLKLFANALPPPSGINTNRLEQSDEYFGRKNAVTTEEKLEKMAMENTDENSTDLEAYKHLAWQTHLSPSFCAELASLLLNKKQIILEGPPGSGKTFVAEHLGRFLALGTDGYATWTQNRQAVEDSLQQRFEIVQFHESYGYEDFVQGFRPSTVQGSMVFERMDGIFVEFCARAREDSGSYVVLIDEINRGKPSKIFGELLYLLEYRGKSIKLSSGQSFTIPDNVLIVGTMNTADKSIALVDYALRRRFCFVALRPVEDGRAPVLASWLERNNIQNRNDILKLFLNLNAKIRDKFSHDLQVGHSYFMDKDLPPGSLFPQTLLESIWKYNILPLVQEYGYSKSPDEIEREFGLNFIKNYGG